MDNKLVMTRLEKVPVWMNESLPIPTHDGNGDLVALLQEHAMIRQDEALAAAAADQREAIEAATRGLRARIDLLRSEAKIYRLLFHFRFIQTSGDGQGKA
jgi:hypothetical protein